MKFTVEQVEYIEKILADLDVDKDTLLKVKQQLTKVPKSKENETCISTTAKGKRCSKKPVAGETKCSIHLKNKQDKEVKKEVSEESVDDVKLSQEQKKMEIELLFNDEE